MCVCVCVCVRKEVRVCLVPQDKKIFRLDLQDVLLNISMVNFRTRRQTDRQTSRQTDGQTEKGRGNRKF